MKRLIAVYSLTFGGAEKQAVVDANALQERGHNVTVAFYRNGDLSKLLHKDIRLYETAAKNVVISGIQLFFHCLKNRYDVVHAHMFWAEKVTAFTRLLGQRIIFNEHGLGVWRKKRHSFVMRWICKLAHVVANSCDATKKNRVLVDKMTEEKLITLYNSFEADNTGKGAEADNALQQEDTVGQQGSGKQRQPGDGGSDPTPAEQPFTVAFVGRFNFVKRLEYYIPLAKLLKDHIPTIQFRLIGDGDKREEMDRLIKENKLEDHFQFPGFVLAPGSLLTQSHAFFIPSLREAFSIALLEAGACGLPAIAFDVGGNSELIKDGETGYIVANDDIETVAQKIRFLYDHPDQRLKMGEEARRFVTETFSIKNRTDHMERIYKSS